MTEICQKYKRDTLIINLELRHIYIVRLEACVKKTYLWSVVTDGQPIKWICEIPYQRCVSDHKGSNQRHIYINFVCNIITQPPKSIKLGWTKIHIYTPIAPSPCATLVTPLIYSPLMHPIPSLIIVLRCFHDPSTSISLLLWQARHPTTAFSTGRTPPWWRIPKENINPSSLENNMTPLRRNHTGEAKQKVASGAHLSVAPRKKIGQSGPYLPRTINYTWTLGLMVRLMVATGDWGVKSRQVDWICLVAKRAAPEWREEEGVGWVRRVLGWFPFYSILFYFLN